MHYHNINELCDDLQFELECIHHDSDYIVNGELEVSTMDRIRLFISWMSTRKKNNTFQLSSHNLLSLTYQDLNKFRQEDMFRMTKVPTTQIPSTTKPFLSHTSRSKTTLFLLPIILTYWMNLFVNLLKKTYFT